MKFILVTNLLLLVGSVHAVAPDPSTVTVDDYTSLPALSSLPWSDTPTYVDCSFSGNLMDWIVTDSGKGNLGIQAVISGMFFDSDFTEVEDGTDISFSKADTRNFVLDNSNSEIRSYSNTPALDKTITLSLTSPFKLDADPTGDFLFVGDDSTGEIERVDLSDDSLTTIYDGTALGTLSEILGIGFLEDTTDQLIVYGNNRIWMGDASTNFAASAQVLLGDGSTATNTDGTGTGCTVEAIDSIEVIPDRTGFFFASSTRHVVRYYEFDTGECTTILGTDNSAAGSYSVPTDGTTTINSPTSICWRHTTNELLIAMPGTVDRVVVAKNVQAIAPTVSPSKSPSKSPTEAPTMAVPPCQARILASIDTTFAKEWNEQYLAAYTHLEAIVDEFDTMIDDGDIRIGIVEIGKQGTSDLITIDNAQAVQKASLDSVIDTKKTEENGKKNKKTGWLALFADSGYGEAISQDDMQSFFLVFTDGQAQGLGKIQKKVKEMKQGVSANTEPKIICVQTNTKKNSAFLNPGKKVCDVLWKFSPTSVADIASQFMNYVCPEDSGSRPLDPCAPETKRTPCLETKRNPDDGTQTGSQKKVCSWNRNGCFVKKKYDNLFD